MLSYERKKSTIGDGHPDYELGALHKYEIIYKKKYIQKYKKCVMTDTKLHGCLA